MKNIGVLLLDILRQMNLISVFKALFIHLDVPIERSGL